MRQLQAAPNSDGARGPDCVELTRHAPTLRRASEVVKSSAHRLVLEQDDSLLWWDQQRLIEITREVGCRDTLRYEHRRAREELLLAIPDAIARCWARGGTWRQRVEPVVIKWQGV